MACNGMLGGLVAITAPCAFVGPAAAVLIGALAGPLVFLVVALLERRVRIDDPVGAVAVHGACGAWGALALGLLADGSYGEGWNGVAGRYAVCCSATLASSLAQLIGVVCNAIVVSRWPTGSSVSSIGPWGNRVPSEVEWTGLDSLEMGSQAYPHA